MYMRHTYVLSYIHCTVICKTVKTQLYLAAKFNNRPEHTNHDHGYCLPCDKQPHIDLNVIIKSEVRTPVMGLFCIS